jgi:D-arginine dehydrogenase
MPPARGPTKSVRRVAHRWAGLRSFVADEDPVVGPDPEVPSFFWLAGQGGFGIMTAPALARIAASLITTGDAGPNSLGLDTASAGPGAAAPPAQRAAAPPAQRVVES